MSKKSKSTKKRNSNEITAHAKSGEDESTTVARTVTRPTVLASVTLKEYGKLYGDLDMAGLVDCLTEQTDAVKDGDLARSEEMLTSQAHALDAIFHNLARRAINSQYLSHLESYLKLALRAQSQCRATWEAVSNIKNPLVIGYVKQANIAHTQQVNYEATASDTAPRAREKQNPQNQLLEKDDGKRLESISAGEAILVNTAVEAVGAVHRPEDAAGKA